MHFMLRAHALCTNVSTPWTQRSQGMLNGVLCLRSQASYAYGVGVATQYASVVLSFTNGTGVLLVASLGIG